MMRIVPFSKNRELIYGLLTRAKKFHAPITITCRMDVTELLAAIERENAEGRAASLTSYLVKATSVLLEKHPRLNNHLFHGLFRKYQVEFDEISCNLVILRRGPGGEHILLPVILRNSNQLPLAEIEKEIRRFRATPLGELPEVQAIQRAKEMPLLAMKYFSFKCRSDVEFYRRYFGTYGLSSLLQERGRGRIRMSQQHSFLTQIYANTASAFIPLGVKEEPLVVGGEVRVRKAMAVSAVFDHHIVDGHDALYALEEFTELVESARLLAPAAVDASAKAG
jgi:pyruvate/2-oxoglutarate dehydrogenase complex dihydrolipoamide acyltransferase (E2) component